MSATISFNRKPRDIDIRLPDGGTFFLKHIYLDADERAEAVEAMMARGLKAAQAVLWKKIVAWEGLVDAAGTPIKLHEPDGEEIKSNLPAVMAMADFSEQVFCVAAQLAANGVKAKKTRLALTFLLDDEEETAAMEKRLADFLSTPAAAGNSSPWSSAGSATSAT